MYSNRLRIRTMVATGKYNDSRNMREVTKIGYKEGAESN